MGRTLRGEREAGVRHGGIRRAEGLHVGGEAHVPGRRAQKPLPRFELVDGGGLSALVEGCDAKNGMDVGFSAKRIADARSMMMVAYGQGYRFPEHGDGIVEELIECRLVRRATSVLYQKKIDEGMSTRGGHLAHAFFAVHQHEPLAQCIHDCRAIARGDRKSPDLER